MIEDLVEPKHAKDEAARGSFADRASYIAPYVRIKARRTNANDPAAKRNNPSKLWIPDRP